MNDTTATHTYDKTVSGTKSTIRLLIGIFLISAALAPTVSSAQPNDERSDSGAIEEVVVTATKRGVQKLEDVPIAIQAFTSDQLSKMRVRDFADFAPFVSSLSYQDNGPGDKEYIIRGINSTGASTVGVYWDEAVITANNPNDGGGRNADIKLFDMERIEVLKGPQGTLYGASSMSGTIRFITNKPDPGKFDANLATEWSDTEKGGNNYTVHGMVNIPLMKDELAMRLVAWTVQNDGFIDQYGVGLAPDSLVPRNNINEEDTKGGRLTLRYTPTDRFNLTVGVVAQKLQMSGTSRYTPPGYESYSHPLFPARPGGDLLNTDLTVSPWDDDLKIYSATGEYKFDHGNLLLTTNYYDRDIEFTFDQSALIFFFDQLFAPEPFSGLPNGVGGVSPFVRDLVETTTQPQDRQVWSTELRYASNFDGPLQFVAGTLIEREDRDFAIKVTTANEFGRPEAPFDTSTDFIFGADGIPFSGDEGSRVFGLDRTTKIDQEAFFGEVSFDATDRLTALVGARYFQSKQRSEEVQTQIFGSFPGIPVPPPEDLKSDDDKLTLKFNLTWQATDDAMVYWTSAEGFRVGGLNNGTITSVISIPTSYGPDSLWNHEIGAKTSWADGRLNINTAAYFIDWKDIQVEAADPLGAITYITNAGKAEIKGLEFELFARPVPQLYLQFVASVQDAKLTESQPTSDPSLPGYDPNAGVKGSKIPNIPKQQAAASASYNWPVFTDWRATLRADVVYRGSTWTQANHESPYAIRLDPYTLTNINLVFESDNWSVSLYGRNLFDKRPQIDALATAEDPVSFFTVRPRTFGLGVTRRF
jgi:outer membrane receptor protein involved in Fe transport